MRNDQDAFRDLITTKHLYIRQIYYQDTWYFSILDVIAVVMDREPRRYWSAMKKRLRNGGIDLSSRCRQFKMRATDGKMRDTDCADTETLLRIIQSIPSPKAEPFKQWLAQVGTERIAEANDPESSFEEWRRRVIASYVARGYDEEWAEKRVESITTRNELTHEWLVRGITSAEILILTDRLHMGTFGIDIETHKDIKGFPITEDGRHLGELRDGMVTTEVALSSLASVIATDQHRRNDSHGMPEITRDVNIAGKAAAAAREAIERVTGQPVVSPINAMPASNDLWSQLPPPQASSEQ